MTFTTQILTGLALGTLTGLFLGEKAAALEWAADGFVKLLQMMVLPYITVSIVGSLGSLRRSEIQTLGVRAAAVIGGLWIVALVFAFLIPLTFPSVQNASFFSTSLLERRPAFDFVNLYIPANPFNSLANNVVPAVVLFSLFLGIALVGVEHRERLLEVLKVAKDAISSATRFVTRLTPYGLFAIAANAAGTLSLEQLSRLQIYLVAYVAAALLVSLWVLPGLVGALTPIRARDMLGASRDSLITAFIAGDLFIVLPSLMHAAAAGARPAAPGRRRAGPADRGHRARVLQLSALGKAAVAQLRALRGMVRRRAGGAVGLSGAGAHGAGHLFRQPHRGGAVSPRRVPDSRRHLSAVSRDRRDQLARRLAGRGGPYAHGGAARLLRGHRASALAPRVGAPLCRRHHGPGGAGLRWHAGALRVGSVAGILEGSRARVDAPAQRTGRAPPSRALRLQPPATSLPPLETIAARRVLRVGYLPDALPFAFFNQEGDLVGFDVELAHRLAREMDVTLAFVPVDRDRMSAQLAEGYCDLVMSGVVITTDRAREVLFSESYLDETVAFVVPDDQRERFASWDAIREQGALTIAVSDVPYYVRRLRELLPRARIQVHGGASSSCSTAPPLTPTRWRCPPSADPPGR